MGNEDSAVRDAARLALMDLRAVDLPALREAVRASRPMLPAQKEALREIVVHVYARGQDYVPDRRGFLGISWATRAEEDQANPPIVIQRLPGFAAYRAFADGDLLIRMASPRVVEFTSRSSVALSIGSCLPGDEVEIDVLRGGRVIRVKVTLDAWPAGLEPQSFSAVRAAEGERYFEKHFAPLLDDSLSLLLPSFRFLPRIMG
jgi:hypothetical protein